ncbi:unnamed protein product [Blepharisma stoltei]|uniref:Uncharacterized protein n=1 Tax=Blepharisma stoltei TaxID=1481888 RepID=A0AAU9JNK9_9CILI|nr:unnamed protein product [Blepharisma stoltei]
MKSENKLTNENHGVCPNVIKLNIKPPIQNVLGQYNRFSNSSDSVLPKSQQSTRSFVLTPRAPDEPYATSSSFYRKKSIVTVNIPSLVAEPDSQNSTRSHREIQTETFDVSTQNSESSLKTYKKHHSLSGRKFSIAQPSIIKLQFPKRLKINDSKKKFRPPLSLRSIQKENAEILIEQKRSRKMLRDFVNVTLEEKRKLYEKNLRSNRSLSMNNDDFGMNSSQSKPSVFKPDAFLGPNNDKILNRILGKIKAQIVPLNHKHIKSIN